MGAEPLRVIDHAVFSAILAHSALIPFPMGSVLKGSELSPYLDHIGQLVDTAKDAAELIGVADLQAHVHPGGVVFAIA